MAIEGPLRELGIHDVFQLLDLSRKTGRLRVTSALRDNEGTVYFDSGRVIAATIRSNPHPIGQVLLRAGKVTEAELEWARAVKQQEGEPRRLGDILVEIGAITRREMERQIRRQIEAVVFELMSWQEGFFSFAEGDVGVDGVAAGQGLSTESLLMEAARRIDEWTRIAHLVPNLVVVPALADEVGDHAPILDLRPNEWEVLAAVDGSHDLRAIAEMVGTSDFDVARIVYGLVSTGVVQLHDAPAADGNAPGRDDAVIHLSDAREALRDRRAIDALLATDRALLAAPTLVDGHLVAADALLALDRPADAEARLRQALEAEPANTFALMSLARLSVRRGALGEAVECWERVIRADPLSPHADRAREGMAHARHLHALVGET